MQEKLVIRWLGHACFALEYKGWTLIADPYEDGTVPGLAPLRLEADAVYCSHNHHDHNFSGGVALSGRAAPEDFAVAEGVCPHDDCGGAKRGMNTVRLFRFGALRVAHMGDVGCMPETAVLDLLRGCDALLLPVGGFYTVDAAEAAKIARAVGARCVIPMHYRSEHFGYDVLDTADAFAQQMGGAEKTAGSVLELTAEAPRGVWILQPEYLEGGK